MNFINKNPAKIVIIILFPIAFGVFWSVQGNVLTKPNLQIPPSAPFAPIDQIDKASTGIPPFAWYCNFAVLFVFVACWLRKLYIQTYSTNHKEQVVVDRPLQKRKQLTTSSRIPKLKRCPATQKLDPAFSAAHNRKTQVHSRARLVQATVMQPKSSGAVTQDARGRQRAVRRPIVRFPIPDYSGVKPKIDCWRKNWKTGGDVR